MPSQTLCGQAVIEMGAAAPMRSAEMGAASPMRSAAHSHSAEYVSKSDSQNIRPPWAVSSTFDWRAEPCLRWALCWMEDGGGKCVLGLLAGVCSV